MFRFFENSQTKCEMFFLEKSQSWLASRGLDSTATHPVYFKASIMSRHANAYNEKNMGNIEDCSILTLRWPWGSNLTPVLIFFEYLLT